MKTMRKLYDYCIAELNDVIKYSKCAMQYNGIDPDLSRMYYNLAKGEMEDAKMLHDASKRLAAEKLGGEDIDPRLMELWEEMEAYKIDMMGKAKAYLDNAQV